jgi:hypothetical protein
MEDTNSSTICRKKMTIRFGNLLGDPGKSNFKGAIGMEAKL